MNQKGFAPIIILILAVLGIAAVIAVPRIKNIIQDQSLIKSSPAPTDVVETIVTSTPTATEVSKATPTPTVSNTPKPTSSTKTPTVTLDPVDHSYVVTARRGEKVRVSGVSPYKDTVTSMSFPESGAPAGVTWSYELSGSGATIYLTVGGSAALGTTKWNQVWNTSWTSGKTDNLFLVTKLTVIN